MYTLIISPRYHLHWIFALFDLITALQFVLLAHTVLPALRAISSLLYHLIFSLHRWRTMKVAALIFCTHTHLCNIDMNIK